MYRLTGIPTLGMHRAFGTGTAPNGQGIRIVAEKRTCRIGNHSGQDRE